jgi:hypothetical protein
MISRHDRSNDVKRKENDQIFSFSPVNIGHGIKGKRPLMITNLTSLSPGATGVHSRSSLSNRNQARRNVYMCVCAWRTKKERKNTTTLRMTDDSRSPAVCCSIASEGIYIYNNIIHTHTVRFFFSLEAKRNAGRRCRCSFSLKKKSTRGDKRSVVAGEC